MTYPSGIDATTVYLGDGAYIGQNNEGVVIFAHDGFRRTDVVFIEREDIPCLIKYLQGVK